MALISIFFPTPSFSVVHVQSCSKAEQVGSICSVPPTITPAVHPLKSGNVASKSHVWVLTCSLTDGLSMSCSLLLLYSSHILKL